MARIASDIKRLQRLASLITMATETCFSETKIFCVSWGYYSDKYHFSLSSENLKCNDNPFLHSALDIDFSVAESDSASCVSQTINILNLRIDEIIKALNRIERKDIKTYDYDSDIFGFLVIKSSTLMFKQIVGNLKA